MGLTPYLHYMQVMRARSAEASKAIIEALPGIWGNMGKGLLFQGNREIKAKF